MRHFHFSYIGFSHPTSPYLSLTSNLVHCTKLRFVMIDFAMGFTLLINYALLVIFLFNLL
ncbi:hypothetical protein JF50_24195 [Pseudoalteromonas luteoviolacea]|uniref:Uncharacterized protein n=1 Tax=Pseudoalteromonas luteoviolacea TaxID=43657 RepID=A0A0C1MDP9_9GAMM|nr:hypothetical protein JF50_24195 [Pseudoalteromonas luteoviolacea]